MFGSVELSVRRYALSYRTLEKHLSSRCHR